MEDQKSTHTLIRHAVFRGQNKRIKVLVYECDKDGTVGIHIHTRRLVDRKSRHIIKADFVIGLETFNALHFAFANLSLDALFCKTTNREQGQLQKGTGLHMYTNINNLGK